MRFYEFESRRIVERAGIPVTEYGFAKTAAEIRGDSRDVEDLHALAMSSMVCSKLISVSSLAAWRAIPRDQGQLTGYPLSMRSGWSAPARRSAGLR